MIYDGVQKTINIEVVDPVIKCPSAWYNNSSTSPPLKNKSVFISAKIGGTTALV